MRISYYSLYDALSIKYVDRRNWIYSCIDLFIKDYANFLTDEQKSPDLIINISQFKDNARILLENNKFGVNSNYFFGDKRYKCTYFSYDMLIDGLSMEVNVNPNIFASRVIHQLLLDYIVNILLFHRGYSNLHSSAVAKDGSAILFTGPGGAGKSSFAFYCLKSGYKLIGDDRIFVKNGFAHPFLECPGLDYNTKEYIMPYISNKAKLVIYLNKLFKKISNNYVGMLFSLKSKDAFSDDVTAHEAAEIKKIIFLQPSHMFEVSRIDRDELMLKFQTNQTYEDKPLFREIFNYSTVYPDNLFLDYINNYFDLLSHNLPRNIEAYLVRYPKSEYEKVNSWLGEIL